MVCKDFKSNHFGDIMEMLNKERNGSSKNCDVMISTGSCNFPVHKCIIGGISSFFKKMFTTDMKEKYEKKASIPSVKSEIMEIILNFIYTCNITITSENVYDLMEAAEYMEIPYLKKYCVEFLLGEVKLNNCLFLRSFAKKYKYEELVEKANTIIEKEFEMLVEDEQFDKLSFEDFLELFQLKNKVVSSEEIIYHVVINWVRNNISTRRSHFNCLFNLIKLENLSGEFIRDVVMEENLVVESLKCNNKIIASLLSRVIARSDHQADSNPKESAITTTSIYLVDDCMDRLICNPARFDVRVSKLIKQLRSYDLSPAVVSILVDRVYEKCVVDEDFRVLGSRLCDQLSRSSTGLPRFRSILLNKAQREMSTIDDALRGPTDSVLRALRFFQFIAALFLHLMCEKENGDVVRYTVLGRALLQILRKLVNNPTNDKLQCAVRVLTLTKSSLEESLKGDGKNSLQNLESILNDLESFARRKGHQSIVFNDSTKEMLDRLPWSRINHR